MGIFGKRSGTSWPYIGVASDQHVGPTCQCDVTPMYGRCVGVTSGHIGPIAAGPMWPDVTPMYGHDVPLLFPNMPISVARSIPACKPTAGMPMFAHPEIAHSPWGSGPHLVHVMWAHTCQTASRSVQPFLQDSSPLRIHTESDRQTHRQTAPQRVQQWAASICCA